MEIRTLTNPPIVEAIIEFRFEPSGDVTLDQLKSFVDAQPRYPTHEPIYSQSVEIAFKGGDHSSKVDAYPSGYRLKSVNENRVIVAAVDRLVVSFHPPYVSWPALRDEAQSAFDAYTGKVSHGRVTRVGMRYINKIKMPLMNGRLDFGDYINTMPRQPAAEGIPDSIQNFETLIVIPFEDVSPCGATVRQVLLSEETESDKTRYLPLILDIDAYCVEKNGIDELSVWKTLDNLRDKKNGLFFASLTDKALEPYK